MVTIKLGYPPSVNRVWRHGKNGVVYQPASVKAWKRNAALCAQAAGVELLSSAVRLVVTLHPKRTKAGEAYKRRLDLDNALKAALDALNGIAFADDSQVVDMRVTLGEAVTDGGLTVCVGATVGGYCDHG